MSRNTFRATVSALVFMFAGSSSASGAGATPDDKTDSAKLMYELGVSVSSGIDPFQLSESEFSQFAAGLADGFHRRASIAEAMTYDPQIDRLRRERVTAMTAHEKQEGTSFSARVAASKGAVRTASGLVYVPIAPGKGAKPTQKNAVKIAYEGKLADGSVFDSSALRGAPSTLILSSSIPCFVEGIQMMQVGGKSRIVCPSEIAYGDRGSAPTVRPGATVEYDIELLEILPAPGRQ